MNVCVCDLQLMHAALPKLYSSLCVLALWEGGGESFLLHRTAVRTRRDRAFVRETRFFAHY